jgi:hypothetical protein
VTGTGRAFSELLLGAEGIAGGDHHDADLALQHADTEFAALGDDWGQAVAAFVRMESSPTTPISPLSEPRPRMPLRGSAPCATGGDCPLCFTTSDGH